MLTFIIKLFDDDRLIVSLLNLIQYEAFDAQRNAQKLDTILSIRNDHSGYSRAQSFDSLGVCSFMHAAGGDMITRVA